MILATHFVSIYFRERELLYFKLLDGELLQRALRDENRTGSRLDLQEVRVPLDAG